MTQEHDDALLRMAQEVTDGNAIDWEAESTAYPELVSQLNQLQILEAVAATHRQAALEQEVGNGEA